MVRLDAVSWKMGESAGVSSESRVDLWSYC